MARPLRIQYSDAIYHVTSRGNERGRIVRDDKDREKWLYWLERAASQREWRVFAFALLDNHYHVFLQTPRGDLSSGMQLLNTGYAGYFNARHRRSGHLFQGRYKAVLIEAEGHWLEVSRYVHLNPVRAGLVERPERWKWSSYRGYHRKASALDWVDYETVLSEFGVHESRARRAYRTYMEEGLGRKLDSPLGAAVHQVVLGSEGFVARIRAMLEDMREDGDIPELRRIREQRRPELEEVVRLVVEHYGVDRRKWKPGGRSDDVARAVAAYISRRVTGLSARAIASGLGYRSGQAVSVACHRVAREMASGRLAKELNELMKKLNTNY